MGMRLLPKSAVEKAKALDKQREIDEGKKLATHIDSLRTLAATEEKNLTDFREKSLKAVQVEINGKLEEKNGLEHAIKHLTGVRQALMEPLDAKWEDVNKAQKINNEWDEELTERETKVAEAHEVNIAVGKVQAKKAESLADEEARVKEVVAQALEMIDNAKEILAQARNDAQVIKTEDELRGQELLTRELTVAARERDASNKEAQNIKVRKANIAEQIRLADMRATLEKELKNK